MTGWQTHKGPAVALPLQHVDTDQLIPARFMSVPRADGYGDFLFYDLRRKADGVLTPDFPLNRHTDASILVSRHNFGSGSSREAAVYALIDAGVRVVIAPSFGDIFSSNAVNNGLLPARLDAPACAELEAILGDQSAMIEVDLNHLTIAISGRTFPFALEESWRTKLMNGWDDIDLTRNHHQEIAAFAASRYKDAPWAWPGGAP